MDIVFKGKYKSIENFEWTNIPKFAVITGPNGVGKSQLLRLLYTYCYGGNSSKDIKVLNSISPQITRNNTLYLRSEWRFGNPSTTTLGTLQSYSESLKANFNNYKNGQNVSDNYKMLIDSLCLNLGKNLNDLTEEEYLNNLPFYFFDNDINISHQEISNIFLNYRLRKLDEIDKGISENIFESRFGRPPWEILNEIIAESELPFEFNNPTEVRITDGFDLKLTNKFTGTKISIEDLSSGESVLISLGCLLYRMEEFATFPRVLLLDEPDAHLHPTMAKYFIRVMKNLFSDKYGIQVIMTTHSPSTIAFTPDKSLFEMQKENPRIVKSASKNRSISLLTSGIITVGKGSKFVLVEDVDDKLFYEIVYEELLKKEHINSEIPIVFIPSSNESRIGIDSGGKTVVEKWVTKLTNSGLENIIQGLIDHDIENIPSQGVHVLNRYSIENYLIDPIIIFSVLLDNGIEINIEEIEISRGEYVFLREFTQEKLQTIANFIHQEIKPTLTGLNPEDFELVEVQFTNSIILNYPKWIITQKGKKLLNAYRNKYGHFINMDNLRVMFQILRFIPVDLKTTLKNIQNFIP